MKKVMAVCCIVAVAALGARAHDRKGLVVHEWGTFLAMNGSDGIALDGMYHEEHGLPDFVHARSRDELRLPRANVKGETPVIYFYTDTPVRVWVEVGFPKGLWTHWYPQADFVRPALVQAASPDRAQNGQIRWTIDVAPPGRDEPRLPRTPSDALWNYTRDVDAAYVSTADSARGGTKEAERFVFYRGLGEASLPLEVSAADGARLRCRREAVEALTHVYVLRIEN